MDSYYKPEHLPHFGDVAKGSPELARKFFDWYGAVFAEGALSGREGWPEGLSPRSLDILQINIGRLCNMSCRHCHVDAGPHRTAENMDRVNAHTVDVTTSLAPLFRLARVAGRAGCGSRLLCAPPS